VRCRCWIRDTVSNPNRVRFGHSTKAEIEIMDMHQDYSNGYSPLRERLMSETMGEYRTFLQSLTADYKKVWRDIALGYFILIICLYVISLSTSLIWILLTIPFGALVIGYWVAYLQLFLHEGAHYNLAANRKINDAICDYLDGRHIN